VVDRFIQQQYTATATKERWPPALFELLELAAGKIKEKSAVSARFPLFLEQLHHYLKGLRIIKVAGTNGKGSVCALLEGCFRQEGLEVGMFTSPHLSSISERFRVNGETISDGDLDLFSREVLQMVRNAAGRYGESGVPSFFESLIAIAILFFRRQKTNIAIFEAGVGGYNDATSLLPGDLSVITSIGLDHQERLGSSLGSIAADKAGIASAGSHLVVGPDVDPPILEIIKRDAESRNVSVSQASVDGLRVRIGDLQCRTRIDLTIEGQDLTCSLPVLGWHQVRNFATVTEIVRILTSLGVVSGPGCLKGVQRTRWRGRLECRGNRPRFIIDAAHNEQGIGALIDSLPDLVPYSERVLLYGASLGKDYPSYLERLSDIAPEVYLIDGFYHAEQTEIIAGKLSSRVNYLGDFHSSEQAVSFFTEGPSYAGKAIIAAGSIFMIGDLLEFLDSLSSSLNSAPGNTASDGI
jgi:dihydrofolate synthase/folylpolyglutamate synthase